jgi:sugar/nucleoside kinase (ribokinase family)
VLEELNEQGVDTSWFRLIDGETTSLSCVITNAQSGARTAVNHPPQSVLPRARELLPTHAPRALLLDGHESELSHLALEQFPAAISILDGGSLRDSTAALANQVDYAIVSSAFATSATGITPTNSESIARCVETLSRRFSSRVAVTLGPLGVGTLAEDGGVLHLKAPNVVTVDSTGAGDLFHGAFVWAMVNGYSYLPALRVAMGAAALSVTRPGGRSSIPERDLTLRFVAQCWPLPSP